MPNLIWTSKRPTVPGWYWWRKRGDYYLASRGPVVVQIEEGYRRNSGWLLYIVGVGGSLEDKPGEWAGPLPHPEEPRG